VLNWPLLTLVFLLNPETLNADLIAGRTSVSERLAVLSPYVSPSPGTEINLNQRELSNYGVSRPWDIRGFIKLSPPKGTCWTVTRDFDLPDSYVCKQTTLSWKASDLGDRGQLKWHIKTGPKDPGHPYIWHSPYRVAQVIFPGERKAELYTPFLTTGCLVKPTERDYQVHIALSSGKHWQINFPRTFKPTDPNVPPEPNLFIQRDIGPVGIQKGAEIGKRAASTTATDVWRARLKAGDKESVKQYWTVPKRHSFHMPSERFISLDLPPGGKGSCRYRAARELESDTAFLECHDTAEFEVVYLPVPCFADILKKQIIKVSNK
jgi:hypothetical protein